MTNVLGQQKHAPIKSRAFSVKLASPAGELQLKKLYKESCHLGKTTYNHSFLNSKPKG